MYAIIMPYKNPEDKLANQRKNQRKNREYYREYLREWKKRNPDKFKEYDKKYRSKHRTETHARDVLNHAVQRGQVRVPKDCISCLQVLSLEAHHPNHNKPLEVLWLCKDCHMVLHRK